MEKLMRWWLSSQFEGGKYIIKDDDAWMLFEMAFDKESHERHKLKKFFDGLFVVEEDGKKVDDFPLYIFSDGVNFERHQSSKTYYSFLEVLFGCLEIVNDEYKIEKYRDCIDSLKIVFAEKIYVDGSWNITISLECLEGHPEEGCCSDNFSIGTDKDYCGNWGIFYNHTFVSLRDSLKNNGIS